METLFFKRLIIVSSVLYSLLLSGLLLIHFDIHNFNNADTAIIKMGLSLFIVWVLLGGTIQYITKKQWIFKLRKVKPSIAFFVLCATSLSLIEEAIATTITNLAPLYGVRIGEAFITASSNYFRVVSLHSVIVFIPMFITLGFFLKKYAISPFQAFILFGLVGVIAEITFSGTQVILNTPAWICIYGLMVYAPAHIFAEEKRKYISTLVLLLLIPIITFSAIITAWIPAVLSVPKVEFKTYLPDITTTNSPRILSWLAAK